MSAALRSRSRLGPERPTVWGLDALQLHERYWAARGVAVARQGGLDAVDTDAEQYLLVDSRAMVVFRLRELTGLLSWVEPDVLFVRIRSTCDSDYRELVAAGPGGDFVAFRREYDNVNLRMTRVALTRSREIAELWRTAPTLRHAWRMLRQRTRRDRREAVMVHGQMYDTTIDQEVDQFTKDLTRFWPVPGMVIPSVRKLAPQVWASVDAKVDADVRFAGPVWVGAGRSLKPGQSVLGPAVLWDAPGTRSPVPKVPVTEIEPLRQPSGQPTLPRQGVFQRSSKRIFDILFALCAIVLTGPVYPVVMLAIWLEDGRPFFFGHPRQTLGGRNFMCLKFRSMRKDAEKIRQRLERENQADGPQFFIKDDPRLTRVGRIIRKLNIDELPQFLNVLAGDMAVVGPRPSPNKENQCCPAWREARLSVRPGVTGLWQVNRTRTKGLDFQEWIRYDIEYVARMSWRLDVWIIWKTILVCLRAGG